MGLSGLDLSKYIQKSPALMKYMKPLSERYAQASGYRQIGLKYDDLIPEESEVVQKVSRQQTNRDGKTTKGRRLLIRCNDAFP